MAKDTGRGSRRAETQAAVPDIVGIDGSEYRSWLPARQTVDRSGHTPAAGVGGWCASTRYRRRVPGRCRVNGRRHSIRRAIRTEGPDGTIR